MTTPQQPTHPRRYRLAGNDNETIIEVGADDLDVEGHRLIGNDDETVVGTDQPDTDGPDDPARPRPDFVAD